MVIGGASNAGKTQLMLHMVRQAVERRHVPGVITMEVPRSGLQRRLYANVTSFNYYDFLPHRWEQGDHEAKLTQLRDEIRQYRGDPVEPGRILVAEQQKPPTLNDIMRACEELVAAGATCVFLDHLQLIKAPFDQIADRATEISEALRWFAHGKRVLIIALSQLNRTASRERDRRPTMHDLWGGTSIESNANQVILIDHSQQQRKESHLLRTYLYLDKNREGPARLLIPVEIDFKTGVWREATTFEANTWPGATRGGTR